MARRSKGFSLLSVAVAAVGTVACAPEDGAPAVERSQGALAAGDRGDLDILFMVDNSSSMTPLQMKMLTQDPSFMTSAGELSERPAEHPRRGRLVRPGRAR